MKLLIIFLLVGLVLGFIKYAIAPIIKGSIGEAHVSIRLSGLSDDKYILLNDVMLYTKRGSTQIDHILISVYGIFVIETKNYNGWIYGGEYEDYWTQNIYGYKHTFRNPLKQNYGHVKSLMEVLSLPKESFIPIVAFSGRATLKVNTRQPVIYIGKIKKTVLDYQKLLFSTEQINQFAEIIRNVRMKGNIQQRIEHIKSINNNISSQRQCEIDNICPRCGSSLAIKKGKYGNFIGCSNYPNCRYTRKIIN